MKTDTGRLLEAAAAAAHDAEWVGVRRKRTRTTTLAARDGAFEAAFESEDEGYMVEVLYGGQFGYAATQDPTPAGAATAGIRALAAAKAAAPYALFRFDSSVRPATRLRWTTPRERRSRPACDAVSAFLIEACRALKAGDAVIQTFAYAEIGLDDLELVSTSGAELRQATHWINGSMTAYARDGAVVQRRSANGPQARSRQGGFELLDFPTLLDDARRVGAEAVELLKAPDCPNDRRTLVLAPDQMMLQIHESVGHPLELDRILGDERNYAGSTFVKLEDIGTFRYGSALMNVTFDPTVEGELACYGADEIGDPARKTYLVKDGILVAALGGLESQRRSGKPGVANQRASSWNRPPLDRMANLNLEPGGSSFADLVSSVEKGVYMQANRSWSIDDHRNKFQFGCEYATLIEDGRLTTTVRNPNYRGVSSTFWRNLVAVGDGSTRGVFGTPNCGKAEPNQQIAVGHASPACAFADVEVFGGGA